MEREFFQIVAYFTYFKNGRRMLDKNEIFESLKLMVQSNKYDHVLSAFLLNLYYPECRLSVDFLNFVLLKGSDYLQKICLNIIDFLIGSEYYKLVQENFIEKLHLMIGHKSKTRSVKLKNMIVDVVEQMILFSGYEEKILKLLDRNQIFKHKKLLYALMKKEETLKFLLDEGIILEEYKTFNKDNLSNYFDESYLM